MGSESDDTVRNKFVEACRRVVGRLPSATDAQVAELVQRGLVEHAVDDDRYYRLATATGVRSLRSVIEATVRTCVTCGALGRSDAPCNKCGRQSAVVSDLPRAERRLLRRDQAANASWVLSRGGESSAVVGHALITRWVLGGIGDGVLSTMYSLRGERITITQALVDSLFCYRGWFAARRGEVRGPCTLREIAGWGAAGLNDSELWYVGPDDGFDIEKAPVDFSVLRSLIGVDESAGGGAASQHPTERRPDRPMAAAPAPAPPASHWSESQGPGCIPVGAKVTATVVIVVVACSRLDWIENHPIDALGQVLGVGFVVFVFYLLARLWRR